MIEINIIEKIKRLKIDYDNKKYIKGEQDKEVQIGIREGIDVRVYKDRRLNPMIMREAREQLELGATPYSVEFLIKELLTHKITEEEFENLIDKSIYIIDINWLKNKYKVKEEKTDSIIQYGYPAAFYGAVYGDIAGSRFEYIRNKREDITCENCINEKSMITDDTILSLATEEGLTEKIIYIERELNLEDYKKENSYPYLENPFNEEYLKYAQRYPDKGYGNWFYQWMVLEEKKPYGSFGNGSAMRVSPIIDNFNKLDEIIEYAIASSATTHNHMEGIKGAVVTAVAGWMAKHGYKKEEIVNYILSYYQPEQTKQYIYNHTELKEFTMEELRQKIGGAICPFSVPAAAVCIKYSNSYKEVINNVLSCNGDLDTIGAIAGSIAGYLYGVPEDIRKIVDKKISELK